MQSSVRLAQLSRLRPRVLHVERVACCGLSGGEGSLRRAGPGAKSACLWRQLCAEIARTRAAFARRIPRLLCSRRRASVDTGIATYGGAMLKEHPSQKAAFRAASREFEAARLHSSYDVEDGEIRSGPGAKFARSWRQLCAETARRGVDARRLCPSHPPLAVQPQTRVCAGACGPSRQADRRPPDSPAVGPSGGHCPAA